MGNKVVKHSVKSGESLWSISEMYGVTLQEIKNYNIELKNRIPEWGLNVGDIVNIPENSCIYENIPLSALATCCPQVSMFEGVSNINNYFGFDHVTNIVANNGSDEYWNLPAPAGSLSLPSNKLTRDGSRWISVAVGKESEVEITFDGYCGVNCISNCKFEIIPNTVAKLVTDTINSSKSKLRIKGVSSGEASLKVTCNGHDIGWYHIWCSNENTIKIDVSVIITTRTVAINQFDLNELNIVFNNIFKQAILKVDFFDLGVIDLTNNAILQNIENNSYFRGNFAGNLSSRSSINLTLTALNAAAQAALISRVDENYIVKSGDNISKIAKSNNITSNELFSANPSKLSNPDFLSIGEKINIPAKKPRKGAYQLYWYVPLNNPSGILGSVINIGNSPAFGFMPDSPTARNSMAHEVAHSLNLRHPNDSNASTSNQYPAHNIATLNTAVSAKAATNTEPSIPATSAASNVMANDPTNLMGYWQNRPHRTPLRYHQWTSINRS